MVNYEGALICSAVGDTLGMAVEGWKREQIQKYVGKITEPRDPVIITKDGVAVESDEFGKVKCWTKDLRKGQFTDDTILTLATALSIVEEETADADSIIEYQLEAFRKYTREGKQNRAFGQATRDAFERYAQGIIPSGVRPGLGTGPAMKMSPVGLWMATTNDVSQGLDVAYEVARATHLDERAVAAGLMQAYAVYLAAIDSNRVEFLQQLAAECFKYEADIEDDTALPDRGTLLSKLEWIADNRDVSCDIAHQELGSSSLALEAFPFAIFMAQKYWKDPLNGLIETVNYGGDCDTTGAIVGAILGAKHGVFVPQSWVSVLEDHAYIQSLAGRFEDL